MRLKVAFALIALMVASLPGFARASDVTYIVNNHRFNFVRLVRVKDKEAEKLKLAHPQQIDVQGLRGALASVNLSRSFIIKKEVDTQRVFNDAAVDYLSVQLGSAFAQAKPNEIVEFSYLQKEPIIILRNDRLNLGKAWLSDDGLHIIFEKLYAKVMGDTDARGHEAEAVARATGLRIHLDVGTGQQMSLDNASELILDLHHNFAEDLQKKANEPPPVAKTMAGEEAAPAAEAAQPNGSKKWAKKGMKDSSAKAASAGAVDQVAAEASKEAQVAASTPTSLSPEQRMKAIDQMRKDGLISKKEYEEKKKDILQGL